MRSTRARQLPFDLAPFAVIIVVWYALTATGAIDQVFLPPPALVVKSLAACASRQFFWDHLAPSMARVAAAFLLCVLIAYPLGMISGQVKWLRRLVHPFCSFVRYLPVAAVVPLCILWFGIGDQQKIAVITIGVLFQLVLLLSYDSSAVPIAFIDAGRTFGLSGMAIIRRIIVPASLPAAWDHLRVSAGWAWSYVVLAELVAGNSGLGYFVIQSQRYLQTEKVFAGILVIGLLGALTDLAFRLVGKMLVRWA